MPTLPPDLSRWSADRLITKARAIAANAGDDADAICQKFNQGRRLEELTCRELAELICAVMINACGYADVFIPEEREDIPPEPSGLPDWPEEPGSEFRTPAGGSSQTPPQETEQKHGGNAHGTKDESHWQGTVANLRCRLRECRLSIAARDARIADLRKDVTTLEKELKARDARIADLRKELAALEKELNDKSASFRFPQSSR